jgi:hypothetical protein
MLVSWVDVLHGAREEVIITCDSAERRTNDLPEDPNNYVEIIRTELQCRRLPDSSRVFRRWIVGESSREMTPPGRVIWVGLQVRNYETLVQADCCITTLILVELVSTRWVSSYLEKRDIIRTKCGTLECLSTWGVPYLEGDSVALEIVLA